MGGKSSEHDISLISGKEVVSNLDSKKYDVLPVVIAKDGKRWQFPTKQKFLKSPKQVTTKQSIEKNRSLSNFQKCVDVVFIAMHGAGGEDGKVQGFLELIGIPYTGSGVLASALGMDKAKTKIVLRDSGLNVPFGLIVKKNDRPKSFSKKIKFPAFVKPNSHGSSVGSSIVKNYKQLPQALKNAFKFDKEVLVEEFIEGTEITCAVLGNKNCQALPLIEIVSKNEFFDFESKYDPKKADEICPARLSKFLTQEAQETALLAYKSIGCQGFARVDMIISKKKIYVLEVNTIPGLTPFSLFPKAAKAAGITYPQLLDKIIALATP